MVTRIAFRTELRAAAVELLEDYAAAESVKLQVYPARPRDIKPPTAFVDTIREEYDYTNVTYRLRLASLEIIVLHGLFDSKEAADQSDTFMDSFLDWVTDRFHAAGPNTMVGIRTIEDDPNYVPDWLPSAEQRTYFATRISLEGRAGG